MKLNVCLGGTVGEIYNNQSFINFFTWGNSVSGFREVMRISQRGYLGVLTNSPTFPLDVNGTIRGNNQIIAYGGTGNGYVMMSNGGTGATGYFSFYNPSGTRCGYIGAMSNSDTYMPIVNESPCLGFNIYGKLK